MRRFTHYKTSLDVSIIYLKNLMVYDLPTSYYIHYTAEHIFEWQYNIILLVRKNNMPSSFEFDRSFNIFVDITQS